MEKKEREYILKIKESQAQVLIEALDFFSRIPMGQLDEIHNWCHPDLHDQATLEHKRDLVESHLRSLKHLLLPELPYGNTYHSIHSNKIRDKYRVAYDLQQVVRHRVSHDRSPGDKSWNVWKNDPHKTAHENIPLATIEPSQKKEDDRIWQYFEHLSNRTLSPQWTERDWQGANQMRLSYEIYAGYSTMGEVFGDHPEQP